MVTWKRHVAAKKGGARKAPQKRLRDDTGQVDPTVAHQFQRTHEIWQTVRTGLIGLTVVGSILAFAVLAHQIVGSNTNFNVNVAIGVSFTLAITNGGTGWLAYQRHRTARYNRQRAVDLEAERDEALERVRELEQ
jgi:hypothetical protein